LIARHGRVQRRFEQPFETSAPVVPVTGQLPATTARNDQVLAAIAIDIEPAHAGPKLTQAARQEWLAVKIIEGLLVMGVLEQVTGVDE
jgi:hypothetical protein